MKLLLVFTLGIVLYVSARSSRKIPAPLSNLRRVSHEKQGLSAEKSAKISVYENLIDKLYQFEILAGDFRDKLEFEVYMMEYNREYGSEEEAKLRWKEYDEVNDYVEAHNERYKQGLEDYELEVNYFADWTDEELDNLYGVPTYDDGVTFEPFDVSTFRSAVLPQSVNLTAQGYVSSVKNQGQCGSCYTYSAAGSIEGAIFKKLGVLVNVSTQDLVDCGRSDANNTKGCSGGFPSVSMMYVQDKGVSTEESYPYKEKEGTCLANRPGTIYKITKIQEIPKGDEDALMRALAFVGPVSMYMDVAGKDFLTIKGKSVYKNATCDMENSTDLHAMLVVGYGTDNGINYWLIKNSWGEDWGDNGYFKLLRDGKSHCGVADAAVVAIG